MNFMFSQISVFVWHVRSFVYSFWHKSNSISVHVLLSALCPCPALCSLSMSCSLLSVHVLLSALCPCPALCSLSTSCSLQLGSGHSEQWQAVCQIAAWGFHSAEISEKCFTEICCLTFIQVNSSCLKMRICLHHVHPEYLLTLLCWLVQHIWLCPASVHIELL